MPQSKVDVGSLGLRAWGRADGADPHEDLKVTSEQSPGPLHLCGRVMQLFALEDPDVKWDTEGRLGELC